MRCLAVESTYPTLPHRLGLPFLWSWTNLRLLQKNLVAALSFCNVNWHFLSLKAHVKIAPKLLFSETVGEIFTITCIKLGVCFFFVPGSRLHCRRNWQLFFTSLFSVIPVPLVSEQWHRIDRQQLIIFNNCAHPGRNSCCHYSCWSRGHSHPCEKVDAPAFKKSETHLGKVTFQQSIIAFLSGVEALLVTRTTISREGNESSQSNRLRFFTSVLFRVRLFLERWKALPLDSSAAPHSQRKINHDLPFFPRNGSGYSTWSVKYTCTHWPTRVFDRKLPRSPFQKSSSSKKICVERFSKAL